jgi:ABC-type antimicrobial peptide transport system permease subunit
MNHTVSLRLREIAIRMALGAQARSVKHLFLRRGLQLNTIALTIGLPVAFVIGRLFNSILYGIKPNDAVTFISTPLFLAFVALLASYIPARRATKLDPMVVLRNE